MTQLHKRPLGTRILQGIALAAWMTLFVFLVRIGSARHLSPRAVALLFLAVGVAGGVAGGTYYATDRLRAAGGENETIANVLTLVAYGVAAFALLAVIARLL